MPYLHILHVWKAKQKCRTSFEISAAQARKSAFSTNSRSFYIRAAIYIPQKIVHVFPSSPQTQHFKGALLHTACSNACNDITLNVRCMSKWWYCIPHCVWMCVPVILTWMHLKLNDLFVFVHQFQPRQALLYLLYMMNNGIMILSRGYVCACACIQYGIRNSNQT